MPLDRSGASPQSTKRLRFSLRTLAMLVALLSLVLASWYWTATRGVKAIEHQYLEPAIAVAPFLLLREAAELHGGVGGTKVVMKRSYFIWCFGYVKELPYWKSESSKPMSIEEFGKFTQNRRW